jgi:hypothetical protein
MLYIYNQFGKLRHAIKSRLVPWCIFMRHGYPLAGTLVLPELQLVRCAFLVHAGGVGSQETARPNLAPSYTSEF